MKTKKINLKRALGIGLVAYIASFFIGILTAVLVGINLGVESEVPALVWQIGLVSTLLIGLVFGGWYFAGKKTGKGLQEGGLLGLCFIAVGFVIDFVLIIPYIIVSGAPSDVWAYYLSPYFWGSLFLLLVATSFVGWWKEKQGKKWLGFMFSSKS